MINISKKNLILSLGVLLASLGGKSIAGEVYSTDGMQERTYQIPYADKIPKLDGKLDDKVWESAVVIPSNGALSRQATFYLLWRDNMIYLGHRSPLRPGEKPLKRFRNPAKGTQVHDDTVEFFVITDQNGQRGIPKQCFQTLFNAADNVLFNEINQYGIGQKVTTWKPGWTTKNRITPDGKYWESESAIPVKDYDYVGSLKDGTSWMLGLCRDWKRPWQWGGVDYRLPSGKAVFKLKPPVLQSSNAESLNKGSVGMITRLIPNGNKLSGKAYVKIIQGGKKEKKETIFEQEIPFDVKGDKEIVFGPFKEVKLKDGTPGAYIITLKDNDGNIFYSWTQVFKPGFLKGEVLEGEKDPFFIQLTSNPIKEKSYLNVDYDELDENIKDKISRMRVKLYSPAMKELMVIDAKSSNDYSAKTRFEWPNNIPFGKNKILIELLDNQNKVITKAEKTLEKLDLKKEFPWYGNNVGISRQVLTPWIPVKSDAISTTVWGRKIELSKDGLIGQIVNQGKAMLSSPMQLNGKLANGKTIQLQGQGTSNIEQAQDRAVHTGEMSGSNLNVKTTLLTEYDGCIKVTMVIKPVDKPVKLSELAMIIPLKEDVAKYLRANQDSIRRNNWFGKVPSGKGVVWDSRKVNENHPMTVGYFVPYVWLGNEDMGLCFFADSDEGWWPNDKRAGIEVVRKGKSVELRLNFASEKVVLDKARTIVFGIMTNPVKPLAKLDYGFKCNMFYGGGSGGRIDPKSKIPFDVQTNRPYPMLMDVSRKFVEELHKNSTAATPNIDNTDAPAIDRKESKYFMGAWNYRAPDEIGLYQLRLVRSMADYYVYYIDKWAKEADLNGCYIDNTYCHLSKNVDMGPAYRLPDGRIQPGFLMWEDREFFKRLQTVFQNRGVKPRSVWAHMTNHVMLPILSFVDDALQGEDRMLYPNGADHIDSWPQVDLVTSCNSKAFGWRCHFLGNWKRIPRGMAWTKEDPEGKKLTRGIIASLWPLGLRQTWRGNTDEKRKASIAIYNFTGDKLDIPMHSPCITTPDNFVPYWKSREIVLTPNENVLCTIWQKKDSVLLMFSNIGKGKARSATIKMDHFWSPRKPENGFYFRENIVFDQENPARRVGAKFNREKNELELQIDTEPHDFRMFQIVR